MWIHVDDTLIAADRLEDIEDFKTMMQARFEITVNAEAGHHLGVNIKRLQDGSLQLTQSKLLTSIFEECADAIETFHLGTPSRCDPTNLNPMTLPTIRRVIFTYSGC